MIRRLLLSLPLLVAALAFTLVSTAAPASAHTELASSTPAEGATLTAPPTEVTLTFNEPVLTEGAAMVAHDATEAVIALGPVTVDGDTVTASWPADVVSGDITVAWRVVADDGHPVDGLLTFSIEGASPSPTSASPTPTPTTASPSPTPTSASPSPTSASPSPAPTSASPTPPSPSPSPSNNSSSSLALPVIGVLVLIVIIGVIAYAITRRRGGSGPTGD